MNKEVTTSDIEQNSGTEINVSMGETGENMSLPESFPKDVWAARINIAL